MKNETIILITKAKIALPSFILVLAAFFAPIKALIILVGLFIGLDTVSGVIRAKKTKEIISSRGFSKIISKMVLYQLAVLSFFALDKLIVQDLVSIFFTISVSFVMTKIVALMLVVVELQSIRENIKIACGIDIWDRVKNLIQRAQELKKGIEETGIKKKE